MATQLRSGFTHHTSTNDRNIINSLVVESIQVVGFDVKYLPRTSNNIDTLFEDAEVSSFNSEFTVEMYFGENSLTGFGGEGDLITRFGYEIRDTVQLVVSVTRFETEVGDPLKADIDRPREGDLIYFPFSKQLYEITFTEDQEPFFQLGTGYIYQLECSLFQYADEDFDTGDVTIDAIETALSYQINLTLNNITGSFITGNTVYQGVDLASATAKAEIVLWNSPVLRVMNIQGAFKTQEEVKYDESNKGTIVLNGISDQDTASSQSSEIELLETGIVDFSESNPFGEF